MQETNEEKQYFEDPDDPPIPNEFKTFQFIECDAYNTREGFIMFNLDYVIKAAKYLFPTNTYMQRCIDEGPIIPLQEYRWFMCPLYRELEEIQYIY
jgi:hypothetical protein